MSAVACEPIKMSARASSPRTITAPWSFCSKTDATKFKFPHAPKRSHSCNGRIETSAALPTPDAPKMFSSRTRRRSIAILDLTHHGPNDVSLMKEVDYKSFLDSKADLKDYTRITQLFKDGLEPAKHLLHLSPPVRPTSKLGVPSTPIGIARKHVRVEKEDKEIILALRFKRIKRGTEGAITYHQPVLGGAKDLNPHVELEALPSSFQALKWSGLNWKACFFIVQNVIPSSHSGNGTSESKNDGQINSKQHFRSSGASSSSLLRVSEDCNSPTFRTSEFVSALHKFNKVIPNCNAMERFQSEPTRCLANNMRGLRCGISIDNGTEKVTRQLLIDLDEMDVTDSPRWVIHLAKLTNLAVCGYQRTSIRNEVGRLGQPELPKGSMQTLMSEDSITGMVKKMVSHILERDESKTHRDQEISEVNATTPANRIAYWLRELPTALHYLPEYLPYHTPESSGLSTSKWILEQANRPLSTYEPDEREPGYLYVYWNRATFGVSKIGCTTRDVDTRIKEWEDGCGHIAEEQYRSPVPVRNVARAEKLIHADLKDYRVFEPACYGCLKSHNEWFRDVDFEIILGRIEFWTQWISKEPYELKKGYDLKKGKWLLKDDAKEELMHTVSDSHARKKEKILMTRPSRRSSFKSGIGV